MRCILSKQSSLDFLHQLHLDAINIILIFVLTLVLLVTLRRFWSLPHASIVIMALVIVSIRHWHNTCRCRSKQRLAHNSHYCVRKVVIKVFAPSEIRLAGIAFITIVYEVNFLRYPFASAGQIYAVQCSRVAGSESGMNGDERVFGFLFSVFARTVKSCRVSPGL